MSENIKDIKNLSFEEALVELENIVRELESGKIKLDDAVEAYEKAVSLKKLCTDKLKAAELKIEKIEKYRPYKALTIFSTLEEVILDRPLYLIVLLPQLQLVPA